METPDVALIAPACLPAASDRYGSPGLVDDAASRVPNLAGDDHGVSATAHIPTTEGGVTALGAESPRVDRPARVGVDDRDVGVSTGTKSSLVGKTQQSRRIAGKLGKSLRPRQMTLFDQAERGDRDQGLQSNDPKGSLVDLAHFLLTG